MGAICHTHVGITVNTQFLLGKNNHAVRFVREHVRLCHGVTEMKYVS